MAFIDVKKTLENYCLTEAEYEQLIKDCEDKLNGLNDYDWADLVEKYKLDVSSDFLRKSFTGLIGGANVKQYYEEKYRKESYFNEDEYLKKLDEKKRELERARIKFRDERNAWQKQNYADARAEITLSRLEESLKDFGNSNFKIHSTPFSNGEKEMIVMLSDLHIGQTFDSAFGEYNSEIAMKRLNQFLNKCIYAGKLHNIKKVHVVGLGDQISSNIHRTIQVTNKENVIEQVKMAAQFISSFCYELTKEFETVQYCDVAGNHSRIQKKDDAIHDERLDSIIGWIVGISLDHIENFHYMSHRNIDIGIADINVCGKTYIACHGDYDSMTKQGVANLSMLLGFIPYAMLRGHMHYPAMNELNGVKVIQSGSLPGCGDDYTIEKRLSGKPSQTFLICDKKGIDAIYNVELY